MNLTLDERTKIFDKVCRLVEEKHFNPGMNGVDWTALTRSRRDQILACTEPEAFEKEVQRLVAELKTSHTGFRHGSTRNIPQKAPSSFPEAAGDRRPALTLTLVRIRRPQTIRFPLHSCCLR